jgi:hypothetical protein
LAGLIDCAVEIVNDEVWRRRRVGENNHATADARPTRTPMAITSKSPDLPCNLCIPIHLQFVGLTNQFKPQATNPAG